MIVPGPPARCQDDQQRAVREIGDLPHQHRPVRGLVAPAALLLQVQRGVIAIYRWHAEGRQGRRVGDRHHRTEVYVNDSRQTGPFVIGKLRQQIRLAWPHAATQE